MENDVASGRKIIFCPGCGTELAPALLNCPVCNRLVHADRLKQLAGEAEHLSQSNDPSAALAAWRQALELLPPGSRQHEVILEKIEALSRQVDAIPGGVASKPSSADHGGSKSGSGWGKGAAGLGVIGLLLWKFKFILFFVFTKLKLLLLGLTKAKTFLSMLISLGVYWTAWGWKFALGLVLSIYVHEMGHFSS